MTRRLSGRGDEEEDIRLSNCLWVLCWVKMLVIISDDQVDGLVQERHNSIANALELRLSSTNPLISLPRLEHTWCICKSSSKEASCTRAVHLPYSWSNFKPNDWNSFIFVGVIACIWFTLMIFFKFLHGSSFKKSRKLSRSSYQWLSVRLRYLHC